MEPPTYMYYAHIPIIFFLGYTYYIKVGKPFLQNMSNMCNYPYSEEEDNLHTDLQERLEMEYKKKETKPTEYIIVDSDK